MSDYPNSTDATAWARAFVARFPGIAPLTDVHEWFAHAIEAGRETGWIQAGVGVKPDGHRR